MEIQIHSAVTPEGEPLVRLAINLDMTLAQVSELQAHLKNGVIRAAMAAADHKRQNPPELQPEPEDEPPPTTTISESMVGCCTRLPSEFDGGCGCV